MKRRKFTNEFKAKVAMEALKEISSVAELAKKYQLHPQQITKWKKQLIDHSALAFGSGGKDKKSEAESERDELLRTIGQLKVENDFLKKRLR